MLTETIKQRAPRDCYICCLAMAVGLSYEEFTVRLQPETLATIQRVGTFSYDIATLYGAAGLVKDRDYKTVYRHDEKLVGYGCSADFARTMVWGRRAILQVKSLNTEGGMHVVYWDGQKMHDPSNLKVYYWEGVVPLNITLFSERK